MIATWNRYWGQVDKDGKACGDGVVQYNGGAVYEGQFKDNMRHGLGK